MKVALLVVTSDLNAGTGRGAPIQTYELLERFKKMSGVDVGKIECRNIRGLGESLSLYLGSMFRDLSGYDIVHNLDTRPIHLMRKGRAVWVNTIHDCQPILAPEQNADLKTTWIGRVRNDIIQPWGYRVALRSDYVIARSQLTKDDVIKLGYPRDKISIVYDGLEEKYFAPFKPKSRSGFKVGYIGSFRLRKNVAFAVKAFKKFDAKDAVFEIWGKPRFEYGNVVRLAGDDKRILFKGFAPVDRIVKIYESFDAFVFPTLYEGMCHELLEAQARGVPVIVYKHGKVPQEIKKYCFEAKDEEDMARILANLRENGYSKVQRKKALEYARKFTWKKAAEDTVMAYKRAIEVNEK